MIVIEGELVAQIRGETVLKSFKAGTSFEVAASLAAARFYGVAF